MLRNFPGQDSPVKNEHGGDKQVIGVEGGLHTNGTEDRACEQGNASQEQTGRVRWMDGRTSSFFSLACVWLCVVVRTY